MEKKAPLKGAKHNRSLVGSNKAQIFCTISNPKNINRVTKFFEQGVNQRVFGFMFWVVCIFLFIW